MRNGQRNTTWRYKMTDMKIEIVLADKSLKINPETYQPYMRLNIGIPLEASTDAITTEGESAVYEAIGRELAGLIKRPTIKYCIVRDNIKYYYRTEEDMKIALAGGGMKLMHMAEAAINVKSNEVLKCRYTMEQIFDNLDLG